MAIRYILGKKGNDGETPPLVKRKALKMIEKRILPPGSPYRVKMRGDKSAKWVRYQDKSFMKLIKNLMASAEPGETYLVWSENKPDVVHKIISVEIFPQPELPSQAVYWPAAQKSIYSFVFAAGRYPGVYWLGCCNCRDTRQGGSLSDHACCNANDIGVGQNRALGDRIYRDLMAKKEFGIKYISWNGIAIHTETSGLHNDHLHVSTGSCSNCY